MMRLTKEKPVSMRRAKRGSIGAYVDAETVSRLGRAVRALFVALCVTLALSASMRYVNVHLAIWRPSNDWPIFLSRFFPIAVGLMLALTTALWLILWAARKGCNQPKKRTR
jgi:hypothetical protein